LFVSHQSAVVHAEAESLPDVVFEAASNLPSLREDMLWHNPEGQKVVALLHSSVLVREVRAFHASVASIVSSL
jgi:hypothetical protein